MLATDKFVWYTVSQMGQSNAPGIDRLWVAFGCNYYGSILNTESRKSGRGEQMNENV